MGTVRNTWIRFDRCALQSFYKQKTVCLDENHFNQNKLFFLFTLIIFYENNWFHEICRWIWNINKRKKYFLNSICTPFGLFDCPQSLYLWAFPQFFKLLKLGKFEGVSKHICLVFISFLPVFYLCYIYYFGLLIFCCQFVASLL